MAASKLVREFEARFETVQDHPEIGPRRDRLAAGLRVHFHRDYALYYRFAQGLVDRGLVVAAAAHPAPEPLDNVRVEVDGDPLLIALDDGAALACR
jgi:plasmid stabilization system protein ParE